MFLSYIDVSLSPPSFSKNGDLPPSRREFLLSVFDLRHWLFPTYDLEQNQLLLDLKLEDWKYTIGSLESPVR